MVERVREGRLQIMLSDEELRAIDDWRFRKRMPSRAAAVRELLRLGIAAASHVADGGTKSTEFGVISRGGPEPEADSDS